MRSYFSWQIDTSSRVFCDPVQARYFHSQEAMGLAFVHISLFVMKWAASFHLGTIWPKRVEKECSVIVTLCSRLNPICSLLIPNQILTTWTNSYNWGFIKIQHSRFSRKKRTSDHLVTLGSHLHVVTINQGWQQVPRLSPQPLVLFARLFALPPSLVPFCHIDFIFRPLKDIVCKVSH